VWQAAIIGGYQGYIEASKEFEWQRFEIGLHSVVIGNEGRMVANRAGKLLPIVTHVIDSEL
jgi:hypothetical protein